MAFLKKLNKKIKPSNPRYGHSQDLYRIFTGIHTGELFSFYQISRRHGNRDHDKWFADYAID
jgi:hypothetical protein